MKRIFKLLLVFTCTATAWVGLSAAATGRTSQGATAPSASATPVIGAKASIEGNTTIPLDAVDAGRTFDGVGAISGGGGNSRLLIDYPEEQRNQILDYLFKPGFGASLQVLKLEIGGDANSTDGSEPSIEHTRGVVNCQAGYEFWLGEQAKLRNPAIKLYALAWAAPGWIGNGRFWSSDMVDYLMSWMDCAHSHGLAIDYLGGWNERGHDQKWFEQLHVALAEHHYPAKVVGDDSDWDVAKDMAADPAFARAIDIIGVHYSCEGGDGGSANSCHSTSEAVKLNKPLWDSESGSQDDNSGAGPLIRAITRGYIDAKMTALLNWPLIAAITSNLPYPTVGLMVAPEPWSGNYSVGQSLWVTAHVTQFTEPGWKFLDKASGYLGGNRENGSYVSLIAPNGIDHSTVVETASASAASSVTFQDHGQLAGRPVHVWATNINAGAHSGEDQFLHVADLNEESLKQPFALRPGYVYTFSTLVSATKKMFPAAPASQVLRLPYQDNYEQYEIGQEARYTSDMQGAYEVALCAASRSGKCLQQMAAVKPIEWQDDSDLFTLIGDPAWKDYGVSVEAELEKPGSLELIGRAGLQKRPQSHQQGYFFRVADTGSWKIFKSDAKGQQTKLAEGNTAALGIKQWHQLALLFEGDAIHASVDDHELITVHDSAYSAGQVGLGMTGYDINQFDDLSVTPAEPETAHALQ